MIRFENVHVQFKDTALLQNLTFTVEKGDKILFYGKSGIGKTTIFRLLLGFDDVQKGTIHFNNQPLDARTAWEIRQKTAYVSQDPDIGSGRVKDMLVRIFSFKNNIPVGLNNNKIHELMDFLRLPMSMLDDEYEKLSGGEKQRIAILTALLLGRDVFLLDEVTSSLDAELKNRIIELFTQNKQWTVLAISHDRDWLDARNIKVIELGR
jgi:putative ABC transport system ATP-binding protein